MTAKDLLLYELAEMGKQLKAVLTGMPDSAQSDKVSPEGMTPAEMVEHLCEAYQALIAESRGEKHEWGSFSIADKSWPNLVNTYSKQRAEATAALAKSNDDESLKHGFAYMTAHDAYHVGQLCLVRIRHDPSWDPYSLYA